MTLEQIRSRMAELNVRKNEIEVVLTRMAKGEEVEGVKFDSIETESAELRNEMAQLRAQELQLINSTNFAGGGMPTPIEQRSVDPVLVEDYTETPEYRRAFMNLVQRGTPIPEEVRSKIPNWDLLTRADANTATTDVTAVIPTTLMNEIIQKLDSYGKIWAKVTKTNLTGAIDYPKADLNPTATWVTETTKADKQKLTVTSKISFKYYEVECVLSQTLLASIVTLSSFQDQFVTLTSKAIIRAIEKAIISGTGTGQPLGITKDTEIPTARKISLAAADFSWANLNKKVISKIDLDYTDGEFIMAKSTYDSYIAAMVDTTGQPVARVTLGLDGKPRYTLFGYNVELVKEDLLPGYDSAAANATFGIFIDLKNYVVNSNLQLTTERWYDYDNRKHNIRSIMIADGKLLDSNGVILLNKAASS